MDNGPEQLRQINGLLDPSLIPIEKLLRRRLPFSLQRQRSSYVLDQVMLSASFSLDRSVLLSSKWLM